MFVVLGEEVSNNNNDSVSINYIISNIYSSLQLTLKINIFNKDIESN